MPRSAPSETADAASELHLLATELRRSVLQLARRLRLQDQGDLGPTSTTTLATVLRAGPLTISELAASEHVSVPTMSIVVSKLEERQLVRRLRDPSDGRICRVELTDLGAEQLEKNRARRTEWLEHQLEDLTPAALRDLGAAVALLERLAGPLETTR